MVQDKHWVVICRFRDFPPVEWVFHARLISSRLYGGPYKAVNHLTNYAILMRFCSQAAVKLTSIVSGLFFACLGLRVGCNRNCFESTCPRCRKGPWLETHSFAFLEVLYMFIQQLIVTLRQSSVFVVVCCSCLPPTRLHFFEVLYQINLLSEGLP